MLKGENTPKGVLAEVWPKTKWGKHRKRYRWNDAEQKFEEIDSPPKEQHAGE